MQITYQKRNGSIIKKYRNTMLPYNIGDETSMGWKVLNIEYEYNNNYYPEYEYNIIINKRKQSYLKKRQQADAFKKEFKTFIYYFIAIAIVNLLKSILGL